MNLTLIAAVAAVGVLHTIVPDHWAPIALLARRSGWSRAFAVRTAVQAGAGHVLSTLAIAVVVWGLGVVAARTIGHALALVSSAALVLFGGYVAYQALRELRDGHDHEHHGHAHEHRHADGTVHIHWHEHHDEDLHALDGTVALHEHAHAAAGAASLAFILGSSPMIEGIPAFFAAGRYGVVQLGTMAAVFAAATIATYAALVWASLAGLERLALGRVERYGELLSGIFIAALGLAFAFLPI
ncbi:MAG: hypothetical protein KGN02_10270 [bacterium]|nr:hypothetical protein [bacterium]